MDLALRPHRGGTVLALGILSLVAGLFLVPLGVVAWIMGSKDLKGMDEGRIDPAGRSLTQIGKVFGIGSMILWILSAGCVVMGGRVVKSSMTSIGDGARTTKAYFPSESGSQTPSLVEYEYREALRPDGTWMKEGPAVRWSRNGIKLEEGTYRDGKRDGPWTYRNEDGSIDAAKSGLYEGDVRISDSAPSPLGDYPVDRDAPR